MVFNGQTLIYNSIVIAVAALLFTIAKFTFDLSAFWCIFAFVFFALGSCFSRKVGGR